MNTLEKELTAALEYMLDTYAPGADDSAAKCGEASLHSAVRQARAAIRKSSENPADWQAEARAKAATMEAEEAALPLQIVKTETGWGVAKILGESALDYEILCETKTIEQATAAAARIESEHGRALSSTQGSRAAVTELQRKAGAK